MKDSVGERAIPGRVVAGDSFSTFRPYCVFLTTASAAQLGFLAAIVEDWCADDPFIHETTLERYQQSVFDRTTTSAIRREHTKWLTELEKIEENKLLSN